MISVYVWSAYIFFFLMDINLIEWNISSAIKYSIIIILFLHSFFVSFLQLKQNNRLSKRHFVTIALFCTACADFFLLFTNYFSIGIFCFFIVQYFYKQLLDWKEESILKIEEKKNIFLFLGLQVVFVLLWEKYYLYIIVGEYALFLVRNLFVSWRMYRQTGIYLPIAIILLFLCDCNVLLANVTNFSVFSILIWLFYVPSQFILEKYTDV